MDPVAASPSPHRDPRTLRRMVLFSRACAIAAVAVGAFGLLGWRLGASWLRSGGGAIEVQPNGALGIVLVGTAILLAGRGRVGAGASRALAALALLIGAVTFLEHLTGLDLGIDRLLDGSLTVEAGVTSPGRMGPPASLNFTLAGAAALAATSRRRGASFVAQLLALTAAPLPLIALVGYAYDVTLLYGTPAISAIALPTAIALLALDIALLFERPDRGIAAHLASPGTATALARRMMLYAVSLPVVLGWIAIAVSGAGSRGALAVSFVVVALTLVLVLLVLRDAVALDRMEALKQRAQQEREASRVELAAALHREQEARIAAEAASRARDEFISTLSHELRTPLNAIVGWNRLLRDGPVDAERLARGLTVVERNGRALAQVVSDLLDMSRIARGVIQIERVEVDLSAALEAALAAVGAAARAKDVTLHASIEAGVPLVLGDPARVQQIAWNLLSNAVKFTPAGGRVDAVLSIEGGRAVLTVEDDGCGISPEFLPHVFERFRQADGSATRRHGGLGLGLALTRELAVLHGGTIEVASAGAGRGATFRVTFPPAPAAVEPAPVPATAERRRAALAGARILVVDDEADSRELLLQLLASWGARPVGAASAREALQSAARERPDLLVSDIAMPGEDGCALIQELRRVERALGQQPAPAVALTAFSRPDDRKRVLAAGFDAHVPKPVEPDELRETLTALLRREPRPPALRPASVTDAGAATPPPSPGAHAAAS
jgi:signal transduction histidine kinase/DNA-binding NarL/FixJ family response regulator